MIAVIDYDVGNLFSLTASLKKVQAQAVVTRDKQVICKADGLILPGVGAFGDASDKLKEYGLKELLIDQARKGKPLLGICLGMQLLFEKSYEFGEHEGLGLMKGWVDDLHKDIQNKKAIVPHMGWNELVYDRPSPLMEGVGKAPYVYFVHSFYAKGCDEALCAHADYEGVRIPALVQKGNVAGFQFHPEKSGEKGLMMLANYSRFCHESSRVVGGGRS